RRHTRLQGDWSSDVCSSDLLQGASEPAVRQLFGPQVREWFSQRRGVTAAGRESQLFFFRAEQRVNPDKISGLLEEGFQFFKLVEIGRASCRERVWMAGGAGG